MEIVGVLIRLKCELVPVNSRHLIGTPRHDVFKVSQSSLTGLKD